MRIRVLSDLHREFGETSIPHADCDLILLAGDIATKTNGVAWIREFSQSTPTAYVCGNHEYYGDKLPRIAEKLADSFSGTNVRLLEDSGFSQDGWHIYGCTLWTDLALNHDWRMGASFANECMNDYKRIRLSSKGFRRLRAEDTRLIHLNSLHRLDAFLKAHDPERTIVMTHHAPSGQSLRTEDRTKSLSCAYASNLDSFISQHQPRLWVHGHLHNSSDYRIGRTRVICNPQGYPGEENPDFQKELIIDLE